MVLMGHPCAVGYNYAQTLQTIKIAGLYRFLGYKNGKNHRNLQKQQKIDRFLCENIYQSDKKL
jgi:hypothetical protein